MTATEKMGLAFARADIAFARSTILQLFFNSASSMTKKYIEVQVDKRPASITKRSIPKEIE